MKAKYAHEVIIRPRMNCPLLTSRWDLIVSRTMSEDVAFMNVVLKALEMVPFVPLTVATPVFEVNAFPKRPPGAKPGTSLKLLKSLPLKLLSL